MPEIRRHGLFLLLAATLLFLPAPFITTLALGDSLYHLLWARHFAENFWAGDLYPRWLDGMNAGLGAPVFFFYGPAPYWITSLFAPLNAFNAEGWWMLFASAWLGLCVSGLFTYMWLARHVRADAAALAAFCAMAMPYRLVADLYLQCSFSQFWAAAWFPLILLGVDQLLAGQRRGGWIIASGYALLVMSNLPSTLVFSAVPLAYAACAAPAARPRAMLRTGYFLACGALVAGIYLYPMLTLQETVRMEHVFKPRLHYAHNFLRWEDLLRLSAYPGWTFLANLAIGGIVAACAAMLWKQRAQLPKKTRCQAWLWAGAFAAALCLMYPITRFVWQALPFLSYMQFPWRFGLLAGLAAPVLIALARAQADATPIKLRMLLLVAGAAGIGLPLIIASSGDFPGLFQNANPTARSFNAVSKALSDEHSPRWVSPEAITVEALEANRTLPRAQIVSGQGEAETLAWRLGRKEIRVRATTPVTLRLAVFYYPGWELVPLSGGASLPLALSTFAGFGEAALPPGAHHLRLTRTALPQERIGWLFSLAGLGGLLLGSIQWRKKP